MTPAALRLAAVAGTAAMALSSTGDAFVLAGLLGLLAADVAAWATASAAALGLLMRWGTTSLRAASGAQGVLGPAVLLGSGRAAASAWCLALGVAAVSPPGWPVLAFGATAGLVAAGPVLDGSGDAAAVRVAGVVAGTFVAWVFSRWLPPRLARWTGLTLAALGVVLVAPGTFR